MSARPTALALLAAIAMSGAFADDVWAVEANGYVELTAGKSETEAGDPNGPLDRTESDLFIQRYNLDLSWRLFPNFQFVAGGLFERGFTSSMGDFGETDTTDQRIRPYMTALFRNALYSVQAGYYRTEEELDIGQTSSKDTQEIYNSVMSWRPEKAPEVTLRLLRTNTYDQGRDGVDSTDDLAEIVSQYSPIDKLQIYYRGGVGKFVDRIQETEIRRTLHAGRLTFSDDWLDRRVRFNAEYDVNYRSADVTTAGTGGEFFSILFPTAGLSLITVTPTDGALVSTPALIDSDQTSSAGINLGLPPIGGDDRPRNLGLDLGVPTVLNALILWVDRRLPQEIGDYFSWDIYTSTDNLNWSLRHTIAPAPFSIETGPPPTLQETTRFDLRFPDLETRYIKVVTRPLMSTVPNAASFPSIFVTELSAAIRVPVQDVEGSSSRRTERISANVRTRVLSSNLLYHELTYASRDDGGMFPTTYTLSNGFSLRHAFNPEYSIAARVAREDSREREGDRTEYVYSASLRAAPLRTLQNSLTYSGRSSELGGERTNTNSIFLYSTAELYQGVNTNLSLGKSLVTSSGGGRTESTQISALATIVPHTTTVFNLLYDNRSATTSGGNQPEDITRSTRSGQASVSYRPLPTLYLFFSYRVESEYREEERFLRNYSVSWTPLPGGSLQLLFRYDESYRSEIQSMSKIISPRVRWNITDRWYFEVGYQKTEFDSVLSVSNSESWTGNMRMWF